MIIRCENDVDTMTVARILSNNELGAWEYKNGCFDFTKCLGLYFAKAVNVIRSEFNTELDNSGALTVTPYSAGKIASDPLVVRCDDERQKMLCEQVIRMCRGEASEFTIDGCDWYDVPDEQAFVMSTYRAKPKKELVVPWEWLDDGVDQIYVNDHHRVLDKYNNPLRIKLDLDGIDLPVTVTRPCS